MSDDTSLQSSLTPKTLAQINFENEIRDSLIKTGHSAEIANAVIGYNPEDIPFIYKSEPQLVNFGELISELWIGTSDHIPTLAFDQPWLDQIKEVIVQWWGRTPVEDGVQGEKEVERLEAHQLPDGSFVYLSYRGVSAMGAFDGYLFEVNHVVPDGVFNPYGGAERIRYRMNPLGSKKDDGGISYYFDYDNSCIGTTILNGFAQFVVYHLGEIDPVKMDYDSAFRFTPLLGEVSAHPSYLPESVGTPEQQFQALITLHSDRFEVVQSMLNEVMEMMAVLAPYVLDTLIDGFSLYGAEQMAVDGILRHPEKISLLGKSLADFSREQRWGLVNFVVASIRQGAFVTWAKGIKEEGQTQFIADTATRNGYHLLNWFLRVAPPGEDLHAWVRRASEGVASAVAGAEGNPDDPDYQKNQREYQKVFDGMCTSFVERFIEYIAQMYLGTVLQ